MNSRPAAPPGEAARYTLAEASQMVAGWLEGVAPPGYPSYNAARRAALLWAAGELRAGRGPTPEM